MINPECIFASTFKEFESENQMKVEKPVKNITQDLLHQFNSLLNNSQAKPKKIKLIMDFEDGSSNSTIINLTDDLPESWVNHKVPRK